jgi:hypothetical protein
LASWQAGRNGSSDKNAWPVIGPTKNAWHLAILENQQHFHSNYEGANNSMNRIHTVFFAALLALGLSQTGLAQAEVASAKNVKVETSVSDKTNNKTAENDASTTPAVQTNECKVCRWFELDEASFTYRYRHVTSSDATSAAGVYTPSKTLINHSQHRELFSGHFKFDREGKYTIHALASTGWSFPRSFVGAGSGHGDPFLNLDRNGTNIFLRQLYFSAKPIEGVEVQYGGLPIIRGQNTEITTFDDDGYIVGERLILTRPKQLFFDEIAVTYAYLGDFALPNINKRYHRLQQSNYHQFQVQKNIGRRVKASVAYTSLNGWDVLNEAVMVKAPELKAVDSFRLELYHRLTALPASLVGTTPSLGFKGTDSHTGFSASAEKTLFKRLKLNGGYAQIDLDYGQLGALVTDVRSATGQIRYRQLGLAAPVNADKLRTGKHLFMTTDLTLTPEFSITTFFAKGIHNDPTRVIPRNDSVLVGLNFNLKKALQRTGIF